MRVGVWTVSLLSCLAACASDRDVGRAAPGRVLDSMSVEDRSRSSNLGRPAMPQAAVSPLAGAFFDDGARGDDRAPSEDALVEIGADDLPDARGSQGTGGQRRVQSRPRMLVYTGQVRVEVPRVEDAARSFLERIEQWGGYLQSQRGAELAVRLPAEHFDAAFAAVRAAGRVLSEARQANDVTEEFVDLDIRVGNARKARERLLEILELAQKVEDILKVETELRRLTEEIERMEGRLKYLRDQVAMATLRAHFQAVAEAPPIKMRRRPSRFRWIRRVGASAVMEGF